MKYKPSEIQSLDDLSYYWMKSDLIKFCRKHSLSTQGGKLDLIKRIEIYLSTGHQSNNKLQVEKSGEKDSSNKITKNTLVKNYNNDAETRKFFVEQLGKKFKFNAYLRQFTNKNNIKKNMTYGDLVDGWIFFENNKKPSDVISSQFEYNQFIKDYFENEKGGTLKMAISAWKVLKSKKGPRTYEQFKKSRDIDISINVR